MLELSTIQEISVWILPLLFAITLHEAGHAWMADRCGDSTARMMGRLSLNPIKHIDLFGTIILPLIMILGQFGFIFGWAKPVPISTRNFKHFKRDCALVALAGPAANLLMLLVWAAIMKFSYQLDPQHNNFAQFLYLSGNAGILINAILCVLNLLPIPPLDGSKLLYVLLPARYSLLIAKYETYGLLVIMILIFTGMLSYIIYPPINFIMYFVKTIFGL